MIITKIEKQKRSKNRSSVFLDEKFAFGIDDFDLFKLKIKVGTEMSDDDLKKIRETVLFSSAKDYSLSLLSRFKYTKKAMIDKLTVKGYDDEVIAKTLVFLESYGFINDFDYAKSYINDALNIKCTAIKKIKYDLIQKGIDAQVIDEVTKDFDVELIEENNILPLAEKKLNGNFEYKNIMKVKRFLASKGFSFELIEKTINIILKDRGE